MGFDFEIHYKPGASNKVADALSRKVSGLVELGVLISSGGPKWVDIQPLLQQDQFIKQLTTDLVAGNQVPKGYHLDHDVLKYKGRVVIPKNSDLVTALLQDYHDSPVGGHSGDLKTYQRLASNCSGLGLWLIG